MHGAQGVGLYRTEIPFLAHRDFPSEEEQYSLYKRVVEGMAGKPVTIRTLDIGADKYPSYIRSASVEPNPFLGWRSIRISLEVEEVFKTQLRAILRVGDLGRVRMLIPMVLEPEEILQNQRTTGGSEGRTSSRRYALRPADESELWWKSLLRFSWLIGFSGGGLPEYWHE
jgi:phosphotransferase system enzyme I (PtsP)